MTAGAGDPELDKIRSDRLRQMAERDEDRPETVIVEMQDLPEEGLVLGRSHSSLADKAGHFSFEKAQPQVSGGGVAEALGEELARITGNADVQFLKSSGTFILEANGTQLKELAGLSSIKAIWSNDRW